MANLFTPPLTNAEIEAALPGVTVHSVLGEGGQGLALKVTHPSAPGMAALKIYGPATTPARVDREIDKLTRLTSPFVVRLFSHGQVMLRGQRCVCAILEYIDGQDGRALVGHLPRAGVDDELRALLSDLALGIAALWTLRVVHRDLKPENVMRRATGRYVILDLGFAKHLDESTITLAGHTCGTPGYMSPEQAQGRRGLTLRSDFFALGVLAYEIATGVHPFMRRQDLFGVIRFRQVRQIVPAVSAPVSQLIDRLLQANPLSRPGRADEVLAGLS